MGRVRRRHQKGDKVSGTIKSITDFGIFIGLDGGIDGLVHLSDISWDIPGEEAIRNYKKGDELEATVLSVDAQRERISLGIKQMEQDPFSEFVGIHQKGAMLKGTVTAVDAKGATIDLGDGIEGYLGARDLSRERIEDARTVLSVGQEIEARYVGVDRKTRMVSLSVRAKEEHEEQQAVKAYRGSSTGTATLGDLLKDQMGKQDQ